jgi:hypothetical protein
MDEVAWGPGAREGSEVDRSRSAALIARLGGTRPSKVRRLSVTLTGAGFAAVAAAQIVPWARLAAGGQATDPSSDRSGMASSMSIADGQTILQFSYYITMVAMLALCGGAMLASGRSRRVMAGTALGAVGGHLLLLLPLVKVPARFYGFVLDNNFGDGSGPLKVTRDLGMWLGVGGSLLLAVAIALGLLTDRLPAARPGPVDRADTPDGGPMSDHDRPSTYYRMAGETMAPEVPVRPAAAPTRTPSNQFAFEGHTDLPAEPAPGRHDHSMYQRPRQDTDLGTR